MATTPPYSDNPRGLHANVVADYEDEEGPPLGTHTGQNRTVVGDHAKDPGRHQGKRTVQANRDRVSRRG
jgi:hypothetical protein